MPETAWLLHINFMITYYVSGYGLDYYKSSNVIKVCLLAVRQRKLSTLIFGKLQNIALTFFCWQSTSQKNLTCPYCFKTSRCQWRVVGVFFPAVQLCLCHTACMQGYLSAEWGGKKTGVSRRGWFVREDSWCRSLRVAPNEGPCRLRASGNASRWLNLS